MIIAGFGLARLRGLSVVHGEKKRPAMVVGGPDLTGADWV
jgi:hypothetical protein